MIQIESVKYTYQQGPPVFDGFDFGVTLTWYGMLLFLENLEWLLNAPNYEYPEQNPDIPEKFRIFGINNQYLYVNIWQTASTLSNCVKVECSA